MADIEPHADQRACAPEEQQEEAQCWICLGEGTASNPLARVCKCPRQVHEQCMARWQLHNAGKSEERTCRFCNRELRDWKDVMASGLGPCKPATPHVRIMFNGVAHRLQVRPGPEGAREFERQVRQLLHLPDSYEFEVTFHLKAPGTGDRLQLQGLASYDAAVHCASLSAANKQRRSSANAAGSSGGGSRSAAAAAAAAGEPGAAAGAGATSTSTAPAATSVSNAAQPRPGVGAQSPLTPPGARRTRSTGSLSRRLESGSGLTRMPSRSGNSLLLRMLGAMPSLADDDGEEAGASGLRRQGSGSGPLALISAWFKKGRQQQQQPQRVRAGAAAASS